MKLVKNIVGDPNFISLENRILNIWTFGTAIIGATSIVLNILVLGHGLIENLTLILLTIGSSIAYWLNRYKQKYNFVRVFYSLICLALFSMLWFEFQGLMGSIPFYYLTLLFMLIIVSGKQLKWTIIIGMVHIIVLVGLEQIYPNWLVYYENSDMHYTDIFGSVLVMVIICGLLIVSLKINYNKQRERVEQQNDELQESNKKISGSIKYASLIQNAVIPNEISFKEFTRDYFVLNLPRDVVSGDFYWMKTITVAKEQYHLVVLGDCTGHGVPGALMSMLGIASLTEVVNEENILNPEEILNALRGKIKTLLKTENSTDRYKRNDSIDLALIVVSLNRKKLYFSGANRPLVIIRNREKIEEIKPDRQPIGMYQRERSFTSKEIDFSSSDQFYFFTDGITDQFNEKGDTKLLKANFKQFLLDNAHLAMREQRSNILEMLNDFKGSNNQIDDILVLGMVF